MRGGALAFQATPSRQSAAALAARLVELRSLLSEHIAEEERATFPVIRRYLSVADWRDVEARIRRNARMSFELPRIGAAVTPPELAALKAEAGTAIVLMLALFRPAYRRMERAIWG